MKKALLILLTFASYSFASAQFSIQKVVFEEYTGAWCGYCPEGAIIVDQIHANNTKMIPVAIHQGDAMSTTDGDQLISFYNPAFPQGTVNRDGAPISRGTWSSAVSTATQGAASVSVSINNVTFDATTRVLTFDVGAQFTATESGDLRIGAMLVEDKLVGTGTGWDQVSYFNNTPGHLLQGAGNPLTNYEHNHVFRAAPSGVWGTSGVIPASVSFGQQFSNTYTVTLDNGWKEGDMHIVAFVSRFEGAAPNQREIINGEEFTLKPLVVGLDQINAQSDFIEVSPNPVNDISKVAFTLQAAGHIRMEVLNTMGQHVATLGDGHLNAGAHTLSWDGTNDAHQPVANGAYLIRLVTEHGQSSTTKVLLQH